MEILISEIPDEGLQKEGTFPPAIFGLAENDSIRPVGDVSYNATMFSFDEIISFHGSLRGRFELQCGTCLEYFPYEANFPEWSSELDLEPKQQEFDLSTIVREDFLLLLPSYPRCDEYLEDHVCPKAHLFDEEDLPEEPVEPESDGRNLWGALDDWKQ